MKIYNLKFEKTKSGNFANDLFLISFDSIHGLNVVRVEPTFFLGSRPSDFRDFYFFFKDLSSAFSFVSRFHVPHDYKFWSKRCHFLMTYHFWEKFSKDLTSINKIVLNSLNHE